MHKLESVRENEKHKIFQDFEIQTVDLISARRPELLLINKKKKKKKKKKKEKRVESCIVDFTVPAEQRVKITESEKDTSTWTLPENPETL